MQGDGGRGDGVRARGEVGDRDRQALLRSGAHHQLEGLELVARGVDLERGRGHRRRRGLEHLLHHRGGPHREPAGGGAGHQVEIAARLGLPGRAGERGRTEVGELRRRVALVVEHVEVDEVAAGAAVGGPADGAAAVLVDQPQIVEPQDQLVAVVPQPAVAVDGVVVPGVELHAGDVVEVRRGAGVEGIERHADPVPAVERQRRPALGDVGVGAAGGVVELEGVEVGRLVERAGVDLRPDVVEQDLVGAPVGQGIAAGDVELDARVAVAAGQVVDRRLERAAALAEAGAVGDRGAVVHGPVHPRRVPADLRGCRRR